MRSSQQHPQAPEDYWQPCEGGQELFRGAAPGQGLARGADSERVNVFEADVGAVEAVVFVDLLEARVTRLYKGDVDALCSALAKGFRGKEDWQQSYREE